MDGKPEQFKRLYDGLEKGGQVKDSLSDEGKLFSFLNVAIKIVKTENVMFGGGKSDENLISKYVSPNFVEDDDEEEESEDEIQSVDETDDDEEDEEEAIKEFEMEEVDMTGGSPPEESPSESPKEN